MKTKKINDMDIVLPKSKAFAYETPPNCPKAHQNLVVCARRGLGKSTSVVNLIEMMKYDRVFIISPTMASNKDLMERLGVDEADVFEDPDDVDCLDVIKQAIEEEAEALDRYLDDMKKYNLLMRLMNRKSPIDIPEELLVDFFNPQSGNFEKPTHKWNGKKPMCGLLIDDCVGSRLYSKGIQRLNKLTILHRHLGGLKNVEGAIGLSLFFLVQSYVVAHGGISKCIRNNATSLILFRSKNSKELNQIVEECSGEIDEDVFMEMYNYALCEKHDFLFIDLHKKDEHPSGFRRNFNEFLIPDEFCTCEANGLVKGSCGKKIAPPENKIDLEKKEKKERKKKKDKEVKEEEPDKK